MHPTLFLSRPRSLTLGAIVVLVAACGEGAPLQPRQGAELPAQVANAARGATDEPITSLRVVTARYRDVALAIADGFVLLHDCETRPEEGPVGTVYVNMGRLTDGVLDPASPEGLIYEPGVNGQLTLVGLEFAIPYSLWTDPTTPQLFGATFQREDEFGVFALHAWVWRQNPNGLFEESNPRVSCAS